MLAAERVWLRMQKRRAVLRGEVVLLRGNTRALEQRVRYINADLNRQWTAENVRAADLERGTPEVSELLEQRELLMVIRSDQPRTRRDLLCRLAHHLGPRTAICHGRRYSTESPFCTELSLTIAGAGGTD